MLKKLQKLVSGLVSIVLVISLVTACSSQDKPSQDQEVGVNHMLKLGMMSD